MTRTINVTRSAREENDSGITGSEAIAVENNQTPSQTISAGVEEEVAFGAFKDHQLQSLALVCDQDVEAQFLGLRYPILDLNVVGPDTITFTGDLEQEIFSGDLVRIEGTVADDGVYLVTGVVLALGDTTLTIADGIPWPAGGGGAVGTFARVASQQRIGYQYAIATATLATGALTVAGDISDKFADGDEILISDSTGNDGYWVLLTVTTDGPPVTTTTLTVVGAALPDNTNDGQFHKVRASIHLTATVPFLWTLNSGIQNPFTHPPVDSIAFDGQSPLFNEFRGDVVVCMVDNASAVNATFRGEIGINATIF